MTLILAKLTPSRLRMQNFNHLDLLRQYDIDLQYQEKVDFFSEPELSERQKPDECYKEESEIFDQQDINETVINQQNLNQRIGKLLTLLQHLDKNMIRLPPITMKLRGRLNETNFETLGISRDNFLSIDILDHSKNI